MIEGNTPATGNEWEAVKRGGDPGIRRWINRQLRNRSCTIVLIGAGTAGRPWIDYEIEESWAQGMGLLGIYIHNLVDLQGFQSARGKNPFRGLYVDDGIDEEELSAIVPVHNPPHTVSSGVYNYIADNIEDWVEDAISIRDDYP